ncbi:MAG: DUF4349 domain-containing protein [Clostridia bacterium]|nr:DUF4349 domain-containing protein [Clostridia bacterium]
MKRQTAVRVLSAFLILMCLASFASCHSGASYEKGDAAGIPDVNEEGSSIFYSKMSSDASSDTPNDLRVRKIIKTVSGTLQTVRYDETVANVKQSVFSLGGYFDEASYRDAGDTSCRSASLTIRIPAEKLDDFTGGLSAFGTLLRYSEKSDDVTLQYVDIESRIAVLEAEENALTEMLAKAETIDNMLTIRRQLNDVQQDLASLKGQKRTFDDLIGYSVVTLRIEEVERVTVKTEEKGFFGQIGDLFADSAYSIGRGFFAFFVWLFGNILYFILFGAVLFGVIWLIRRIRAGKEKKRNASKRISTEETGKSE